MARPIVLSNGELQVGINEFGLVHDFYYPYVGLENHSAGENLRHKVGIWINGELSWLDEDPEWTFSFRYPHRALIGHTVATHSRLGIILEFDDTVDSSLSAFLRNIHIVNTRNEPREVRLFLHQAFAIGDSRSNTDTAQYLPDSDALLHYRGRRAFIISGQTNDTVFDQHSIGLFGIEGREGTYKDAEDGELGNSNVEHGRVDSVIRFKLSLGPLSSERVHYWIAAGKSTREALYIHKQIKDVGLSSRIHETATWWEEWLLPATHIAQQLPKQHQESFLDSVMIIKSQIDKRGAVIASTDTSMLNYSRDTYAYTWPRDGAFVLWPLIRMGYKDEPYRFFEFCKRALHANGYLMHKYRADGSLGSSWHPYVQPDGSFAAPIQEDETALVLYVFAQFYQLHNDGRILKDFYESMVVPMAEFLSDYIEPATGLPSPSYDLWEEVFLTTTYTVSSVYGALVAASDLATAANDHEHAIKWRTAAGDIQTAAHKHLYNEQRRSFYKGIIVRDEKLLKDPTIDLSSIFGVFMFGLFADGSRELTLAVETAQTTFGLKENPTPQGLPRYENDNYRRTEPDQPSNWWFITTLWLAQYELVAGRAADALKIVDWLQTLALPTGMLSEQINPLTNEQISPAPLTWSQAEYVSTLLDYLNNKPGETE